MKVKELALAATAMCALSCTDFENGFNAAEVKYEQAFIDRFGEIDPNQNWGFGEGPVVRSYVNTRANGTGSSDNVDVNTNMWTERGNDQITYKSGRLVESVTIPGWPNFDGKYYSTTGTTLGTVTPTLSSLSNSDKAAGDLTEYEIKYVTEFFQTHNKTEIKNYETKLHLTDFFVQNVSRDADRTGDHKSAGTAIKTAGPETIGYNLDYLHFKPEGAADFPYIEGNPEGVGAWTHINEFNAGTTNDFFVEANGNAPYPAPTTNIRVIHYVHSSGTEDFACRASFGTGADASFTWIHDWVLVRLTWTEEGIEREGYYLAFDYSAEKENVKISPDGYYSNWIIKITPAYPNSTTPSDETTINMPPTTRRIMCEDLGSSYDFDFNDVVFDVQYEKVAESNYTAIVTLQAAGGTLPVYIGEYKSTREVHYLFGIDKRVPVNAGKSSLSRPVAIFRLNNLSNTDPRNIPVYVDNPSGLHAANIDLLEAAEGEIPQKICVPGIIGWAIEETDIQDAYPFFNKWISHISQPDEQGYLWTCAAIDWPDLVGYTARIAAAPVQCNYSYTSYNKGKQTGSNKDVKQLVFSNGANEKKYNIWHSYKNEALIMGAAEINPNTTPTGPTTYTLSINYKTPEANGAVKVYQIDNDNETLLSQYTSLTNETRVRLEATCNNDEYVFDKWVIGGVEYTDNSHVFTVNSNTRIDVYFKQKTFDFSSYGYGEQINYDFNATKQNWGDYAYNLYFPLSLFENGKYTISIACKTQNPVNANDNKSIQIAASNKQNNTNYSRINIQTTKIDNYIAVYQFDIVFPIANDNNYNYLEILEIFNGLAPIANPILDIRMKKADDSNARKRK